RVDERDLPHGVALVLPLEDVEHLGGGQSLAQEREPPGPERTVRPGLRGERTDPGRGRGDDRPDGEGAGGRGDAVHVTVPSDDGKGHRIPMSRLCVRLWTVLAS